MKTKHLSPGINIIFGIAFIAALITTGYYRSQYLAIKDQPPKEVIKKVEVESPEKDAEIADLKKQLADLGSTKPKTSTTIKAKSKQVQTKWGSQRMSLKEMKVNNPERYQKIMDYYNSMNSRVASGVEDKMVFFNELDTANMTEEELENHQKLLEKLAKMHEATEKAGENPDDIKNNMRSQWKNYRELSKLMQKERDYLILDAGRKMGFDDTEAKLLRDYVNNAHEITSGRSFFRGGGRRSSRK